MPNLTPAQRRELRALAHHLQPVVMIGDAGLTPAVAREIDANLKSHELIKIRVLGDDRDTRDGLIDAVCKQLEASPIQHIGKILVVYRPRPADAPAKAPPAGTRSSPGKRYVRGKKTPHRTKRSFQGS